MATVMTNAQRTHADKALAGLEQSLTAVLNYGVGTSERDQFTTELTEIRSQRQALDDAHPNEAYRWTKAATARTNKVRKKYAKVLAAAAETREQKRATSRRAQATTAACTATITDTTAATVGDALHLPHTDEHRELLRRTTALLHSRSQTLQRSARVTTGPLRSAIKAELEHVVDDLRMVKMMNYRKVTACMDYHQRADGLWKQHGAEALVVR